MPNSSFFFLKHAQLAIALLSSIWSILEGLGQPCAHTRRTLNTQTHRLSSFTLMVKNKRKACHMDMAKNGES